MAVESEARKRHAVHFLDGIRRSNEYFVGGGAAVHRALDLFDSIWPQVKTAMAWAQGLDFQDKDPIYWQPKRLVIMPNFFIFIFYY